MNGVDEILTADEVAAMMTLARDTLYGWRARNAGPPSFKIGRRVVYRRSVVIAWLAEQEQATSRGGAA